MVLRLLRAAGAQAPRRVPLEPPPGGLPEAAGGETIAIYARIYA